MPTRILREGIITSEPINSLSPQAELFYRRLMSIADDYGRYYANTSILRANCYPLQLDKVSERNVSSWLGECLNKNLIVTYGESTKYIQIIKFGQQTRSKSKFPECPKDLMRTCLSNVKHLQTDLTLGPNTTTTPNTSPTTPPNSERDFQKEANEIYSRYPRKVGKPIAIRAIVKALQSKPMAELLELTTKFAQANIGADPQFIPHPSTWFNQERFNDDPSTWKINQRGSGYTQVVNRNLGNSNSELDPNDYANLKCPN